MASKVSRRDAFQAALIAGAIPFASQVSRACGDELSSTNLSSEALAREADGLTSYLHGGQVTIRWNNFVIATYRANPIQKYPYFSHLAGPVTGLPLTTESSLPFPHHRGLWLACDPLNGGDYWTDTELEKGQIRSIDLQVGESANNTVEIHNRCQWLRREAASPLIDQRKITFGMPSERIRWIDFDVQLTALEKISVKKAKHSFFALRVAPDLSPHGGGRLENSAGGIGEAGTFGKSATWCGYYGRRAGHSAIEGIAVMDHPENPWNPCPWFTRDYGHLSPSPFNFLDRPWELFEGSSIRLRYRVVLHAGTPQEAGLDRLYREWISA
jgi:hypothetical protein